MRTSRGMAKSHCVPKFPQPAGRRASICPRTALLCRPFPPPGWHFPPGCFLPTSWAPQWFLPFLWSHFCLNIYSSAKNSWISSATAFKPFIFRPGGWNVQSCLRNPLGEYVLVIFSDIFFSVFQKIALKVYSLREEETECLPCPGNTCTNSLNLGVTLWHGFYYFNLQIFWAKDTDSREGVLACQGHSARA